MTGHPFQAVHVVDEPMERRGRHSTDVLHGASVADEEQPSGAIRLRLLRRDSSVPVVFGFGTFTEGHLMLEHPDFVIKGDGVLHLR